MIELFWGCLAFGVMFTIIVVIFGDVLGDALSGAFDFLNADFLNPVVLTGGITAFGAAGLLLEKYTPLSGIWLLLSALGIGFVISVGAYFFYVKPMNKAENSIGYSIQGLVGKLAEVIVPIPKEGYGEVLIKAGAGNTNQIAASFDGTEIQAGTRVVVVDVKDDTLYVTRFDKEQ